MNYKKILTGTILAILLVALIFLFVFSLVDGKDKGSNQTASADNSVVVSDPANTNTSSSEPLEHTEENLSEMIANFLQTYYYIAADETSGYSLNEHFDCYSVFLTDNSKEKLRPTSDAENEMTATDATKIYQQLFNHKSYYADVTDKTASVLIISLVASSYNDFPASSATYLMKLNLRTVDDKWMIDDVIVNEKIEISLPVKEIFN